MKVPVFPMWIICKEYHYSVVFCKDYRANEEKPFKFDVIFYDGLYNPSDKLVLTIKIDDDKDNNQN